MTLSWSGFCLLRSGFWSLLSGVHCCSKQSRNKPARRRGGWEGGRSSECWWRRSAFCKIANLQFWYSGLAAAVGSGAPPVWSLALPLFSKHFAWNWGHFGADLNHPQAAGGGSWPSQYLAHPVLPTLPSVFSSSNHLTPAFFPRQQSWIEAVLLTLLFSQRWPLIKTRVVERNESYSRLNVRNIKKHFIWFLVTLADRLRLSRWTHGCSTVVV